MALLWLLLLLLVLIPLRWISLIYLHLRHLLLLRDHRTALWIGVPLLLELLYSYRMTNRFVDLIIDDFNFGEYQNLLIFRFGHEVLDVSEYAV